MKSLHHVEMCVSDASKRAGTFVAKFGFQLFGFRTGEGYVQWVVRSKSATVVVTERLSRAPGRAPDVPFLVFCCGAGGHATDSVFNAAFEVEDVKQATKKALDRGSRVVAPPAEEADQFGTVEYSVVASCCGNVVHTLLSKKNYRGVFLPGFVTAKNLQRSEDGAADFFDFHIDHVTFVCHPGESRNILRWYERVFGMERLQTNRRDTPDDGLVIADDVNIRLRALQYWPCAESGLINAKHTNLPDQILRIVIAESLPYKKNPHIESFLTHHKGPGIQHLGLHSSSIATTVSALKSRSVEFRSPPPTYYDNIKDILSVSGEDAKLLRSLGILLDVEEENCDKNEKRYLMQIFTYPIFSEETFFLEIIQRCGARGFGAGNVTALARSIDLYKKLCSLDKKNLVGN